MNNLVEKLLEPVSAAEPCGPDLSYDPRFDEIEALLKGQPEIEMGSIVKPAEPPDWNRLKDRSIEFATATKHLRPTVILCCSLLQVDGLGGFRDGLLLVQGLLEQYWPTVHPQVDPEDTEDPYQQRLSNLGSLTAPRGAFYGWLKIIDYLYAAPICRPKGVDPVSLEEVLSANESRSAQTEGGKAGNSAEIATKFRASKPEELAATHAAVSEAIVAVHAIDKFLSNALGSTGSISFEELTQVLTQIQKALAPHLSATAAVSAEGAETAPGGSEPVERRTVSFNGTFQNREEISRALDGICEYYRQMEPGSPVPLLLRRAQKLVEMNFVDAMKELNLAGADQLRPIIGSVLDSYSSTDAPAEAQPSS